MKRSRREGIRLVVSAAAMLAAGSMRAQGSPAFEVATLKRSPPPPGDRININLGTVRNGMLTLENASLSDCLRFAYGLVSDQQLAGPEWIKSKAVRFDIVAKAPPGAARDLFPLMLRPLLSERLQLTVHFEKRELPYLALVIGKNGSKLRPARVDAPPPSGPQISGRIVRNGMSMQQLVTLLSRFQGQTVLDLTGLAGPLDVDLQWTPDTNRASAAADDDRSASHPSLFTAVQEQLGLRLESRKGPVDVLVVDHAEQVPAEN